MKKQTIAIGIILFLLLCFARTFGLAGEIESQKGMGYILIDELVALFNEGPNVVNLRQNFPHSLEMLMIKAKQAKKNNEIDKTFYNRYTRLLHVLRISLRSDYTLFDSWETETLTNFYSEQFRDSQFRIHENDNGMMNGQVDYVQLALAIEKEIDHLRTYLDKKEKATANETEPKTRNSQKSK